jgi:hypothetical protein
MRPLYETQADRDGEREIVLQLCNAWDCMAEKGRELGFVDYYLYKPKTNLIAVVEIKNRKTLSLNKFPAYMISKKKITNGLSIGNELAVPYLLVVNFAESLMFAEIKKGYKFKEAMGGRKDRGDPNDIEEVVFIPISLFKPI